MKIFILVLIFIAFVSACTERPTGTIAQSQLEDKIRDYANILNVNQEENIYGLISSFEREAGSPISIITIDSLHGESIHSFANRKAKELHRDKSNTESHILITIVVQNKEIFIHTGNHLQQIVKKDLTNKIIREDMAPRFRKNRYGSGIFVAVSKMKKIFRESKEADLKLLDTETLNDNPVIAGR